MITQDQIEDWEDSEAYYTQAEERLLRESTVAGMVKEFSRILQQEPDPDLYESLILEEFEEWDMSRTPTNELKELSDLVYVIYGYANAKGWDLDEAIYRVHANNIGRCIQADGSIQRREDGKILKRKDYPKVELGDLL